MNTNDFTVNGRRYCWFDAGTMHNCMELEDDAKVWNCSCDGRGYKIRAETEADASRILADVFGITSKVSWWNGN